MISLGGGARVLLPNLTIGSAVFRPSLLPCVSEQSEVLITVQFSSELRCQAVTAVVDPLTNCSSIFSQSGLDKPARPQVVFLTMIPSCSCVKYHQRSVVGATKFLYDNLKSPQLKLIEGAVFGWPLTKVLLDISCPAVAPISIDREGSKVSDQL